MQRRKVLLPDPDGPTITMTSPRPTSRSMPLRTSRRPKRLCTFSALTMGPVLASLAAPVVSALRLIVLPPPVASTLSRCARSSKAPAAALGPEAGERPRERQRSLAAAGPAGEAALQEVLADAGHGRDGQVPDRDREQQLEDQQVLGVKVGGLAHQPRVGHDG